MAIGEKTRQRFFNEENQPKVIKALDQYLDLINYRELQYLLDQFREFKSTVDALDDVLENFVFFWETMMHETAVRESEVEETTMEET